MDVGVDHILKVLEVVGNGLPNAHHLLNGLDSGLDEVKNIDHVILHEVTK